MLVGYSIFVISILATLHIKKIHESFNNPSHFPYVVWKIDFICPGNKFWKSTTSSYCTLMLTNYWYNDHHHWLPLMSSTLCLKLLYYTTDLDMHAVLGLDNVLINYDNFDSEAPKPSLEPLESKSIQRIKYGTHNLFHSCGILISKSPCLLAGVSHD